MVKAPQPVALETRRHPPNEEIAAAFDEMAELLSIHGDNPFRIRAYQRAAQTVRTLPQPLAELRGIKSFDDLPGVGAGFAQKIDELLRTGHLHALEQLRHKIPAGLRELLQLPGLGPIRVRTLYKRLGIRGLNDLRRALADGRLNTLAGISPAIQGRLRSALAAQATTPKRWAWSVASQYGEPLADYLQAIDGVTNVAIAGSYRRGRDTVGDLDLVIGARRSLQLPGILHRYTETRQLVSSGATRCTIVLRSGPQADVRLVGDDSFGAALLYFTGSRDHNIRLRRRAQQRGLKLNEYGLFRASVRIAGATEQQVYAELDLPWIAPELRENRGEIGAAERDALPTLIELEDLRGDLHVHTNASDGRESLAQIVRAARARGLKFIAITDHSRYLGVVRGLDTGRLSKQIDAIDEINSAVRDFTILKGIEVDILEDGKLALPDSILRRLDVVVAAVHSLFALPEAKQTTRVLRALERPSLSILAHPTGRLIGEREPYAIDFSKILAAAKARPCFVELNSQPARLDLDDLLCRSAKESGVLVSIASDAHAGADFDNLVHGVRQARRGWLSAKDVLNARPITQVRKLLAQTRL